MRPRRSHEKAPRRVATPGAVVRFPNFGESQPNMESIQPQSVVLTGFNLSVICPNCGVGQLVGGTTLGLLGPTELVELIAGPGFYRLKYELECWTCASWLRGELTISSKAATSALARAHPNSRVWAG